MQYVNSGQFSQVGKCRKMPGKSTGANRIPTPVGRDAPAHSRESPRSFPQAARSAALHGQGGRLQVLCAGPVPPAPFNPHFPDQLPELKLLTTMASKHPRCPKKQRRTEKRLCKSVEQAENHERGLRLPWAKIQIGNYTFNPQHRRNQNETGIHNTSQLPDTFVLMWVHLHVNCGENCVSRRSAGARQS